MKTTQSNEDRIVELLGEIRDLSKTNMERYEKYLEANEKRSKKVITWLILIVVATVIFSIIWR